MAALTITTANALLNATLRATSYASPGTVYLACFTTNPTSTGGGQEVTGGSYTRVALTFSAPSNGATSNANEVDILGMPPVTIKGLGIMDSPTGGNMLYYGTLLTAKTTNSGDTFTVKVGDLNIALS